MSGEEPRIGVFVCHCGKNIAGSVNVEEVVEFASKLPHVVVAKDYMFMCSEPGQKLIKEAVAEHKLNRVVVAACTPKLHEPTFRRVLEEAGLNKFLFEQANIREQCSWAHMDNPEKATEKAKAIIAGAVHRVATHEPIGSIEEPVAQRALVIGGGVAGIEAALALAKRGRSPQKSVLVIGGGIAGMQASLDLADRGYHVYLVERESVIGGNMAKVYKTFPTDDCAMCILSPKLNDVGAHPNITIYTLSEVVSVEGEAGNFRVKIRQKPRYVDLEKCTGCGTCAEKCPARVPDPWNKLGRRKAIYLPYPQAIPRKYAIDRDSCLYFTKGVCRVCEKLCPAGAINFEDEEKVVEVEVGAIIVATGFEEFDPTPLKQYGFGKYPNVITQLQLARMFDPSGPTEGKVVRLSDNQPAKKIVMVQCVGSRDEHYCPYCSAICCMIALKHAQLIKIEQDPDAEITICYIDMRAAGKGYEEYYQRAQKYGIRFVRGKVAEVYEDPETKEIIARVEDTLSGNVLELRADLLVLSAAVVPSPGTSELAKVLGIETNEYGFISPLHPKISPVDTSRLGIFVCGCATGPRDIPDSVAMGSAAAARAAEFLESREFEVYLVEKSPYLGGNAPRIYRTFLTDDKTADLMKELYEELEKNPSIKIFTNSTVEEVSGFLGNFEVKVRQKPRYVDLEKCTACGKCAEVCPVDVVDDWNAGLGTRKAIYMPHPMVYPRSYTIDPESCRFGECGRCAEACPEKAINLEEKPKEHLLRTGTILLATGLQELKPAEIRQYGFGHYSDVITQLQLARMLDPNGPTEGKLVRPSDGSTPKSVVMVQCVGSRDEHYCPYCSRICCGIALKSAREIKELYPDTTVYICYIDMRAMSYLENYYRDAQERGVVFVRGKVGEVAQDPATGGLVVRVEDTLTGSVLELSADLVVLSAALVPPEDAAELAKKLGIDIGPDGFAKEIHPKLRPVDTKISGIFICGGIQGPKDLSDSVVQALASTAKASIPMAAGQVEIELAKAIVDESLCVGCEECAKMCPYDAIEMVEVGPRKRVARVIEVKCEGCGACAATCRVGAVQLRHYKDPQILAQIEGILAYV